MTIQQQAEPALALTSLSSRRSFTIGQLAREFGLTLRALRFYEDRGLLTPRRDGSARIYSQRDRERLSVIVKAKALGFTLSEIKDTIAAEDARADRNGLALTPSQIVDQIAHLENQKAEIDAALSELRALRATLRATEAA